MMNKLKALVEKVDNICEQMGNFSRDVNDMEMLRKNGDIKNGFDGLSSRHGTAKKRISGADIWSIRITHNVIQKLQENQQEQREWSICRTL